MRIKKIIAGIMTAVLSVTSAGCFGAADKKATEAVEDAAGSYISRVLAGKKASKYVDAKNEAEFNVTKEQELILKCVLEHSVYEITGSEASAKEKEGSVTVELRYADAEKAAEGYFDYDLKTVLDDIENTPEKDFLSKEIEISLVQDGDKWLVKKKSDSKFKKELQEIVENIYLAPGEVPATIMPEAGKIGISLPTKDLMRWNQDGDRMRNGLADKGYEVDLMYASNDVSTQQVQIMDMINSGCSVIIIAAIDPASLAEVLNMADGKGITVIAYDRIIYHTDKPDYYVAFDNYLTGVLQAEYVANMLKLDKAPEGAVYNIEFTAGDRDDPSAKLFFDGAFDVLYPYIDSGLVNVRSAQVSFPEVCTDAWNTDMARGRAENIIGRFYPDGTVIDAWICSNDSTALGVEAALEAIYKGPYPIITGQDCDITNVKNIISGKQAMSVFKDTRTLADRAVTMADQILSGQNVEINDTETYTNGTKPLMTYLCSPVTVDVNNYKDILIDSGYYTPDMLI